MSANPSSIGLRRSSPSSLQAPYTPPTPAHALVHTPRTCTCKEMNKTTTETMANTKKAQSCISFYFFFEHSAIKPMILSCRGVPFFFTEAFSSNTKQRQYTQIYNT
ncbi:hypothetical protein V6Z12_A02G178100 [Gossypium hirsutum]